MKKRVILILMTCILVCQQSIAQCIEKTEQEWKSYFNERLGELDAIEGIWSCDWHSVTIFSDGSDNVLGQDHYNCIIFKINNIFMQCNFSKESGRTEPDNKRLKNGDYYFHKTTYKKTAIDHVYVYESLLKDGREINNNANAYCVNNMLRYSVVKEYEFIRSKSDYDFVKTFPIIDSSTAIQSLSGSGFALTSNGYIATNYHVVKDAKTITVKGINGILQKSFNAKLVTADKNNDLAIIQIDDPSFSSIHNVPYIIARKTLDVGSFIFVLGYPLRVSMGDEIKLTNGIISSKSGYQGDVTTYQISAPIQPGNSGGPMFDSKGNLIGIVNAKLTGAENASYAIKASYLLNLIETLSTVPKLQTVSSLANQPLTEQVKIISNFTYIIEVR